MIGDEDGCRYCDPTYDPHCGVCNACSRVRLGARSQSGRRMDMSDQQWRAYVRKERKLKQEETTEAELKPAEADAWVIRLVVSSLRRLENGFAQTDEGRALSEEGRAEVRAAMLRLADELLKRIDKKAGNSPDNPSK